MNSNIQRQEVYRRIQTLSIESILRSQAFALSIVCCVWLLMVVLVNPVGEFPLNDDWSYALPVKSLIENGHLELSGFTSMPLIAQVLWGALFSLPFGFSFTALRISTITLGLIGILETYWMVKDAQGNHQVALFSAAVVAVNPLYFNLSLTFMTDVPFFAFSMLGFIFLLRALRNERNLDLLLGFSFSLLSLLIRQLAIIIPVSFFIAYFLKHRFSRKVLINAMIPTGAFMLLLLFIPKLLQRTIGLPALYNRSFEPIAESAVNGWFQIPVVLADRLLVEFIYAGIFALPFLILLGLNTPNTSSRKKRNLLIIIGPLLYISVMAYLYWQGRSMPLSGNIFYDLGLGPLLLRDTYLLKLPDWPVAPAGIWFLITAVAVACGILLIYRLGVLTIRIINQLRSTLDEDTISRAFFLSAIVLYFIIIGIAGFLDRYFIWLLPLLMCVVIIRNKPVHVGFHSLSFSVSVVFICIYGLFALGGAHDYFSWNRARWQAVTELMNNDAVSYANIDGGFEFNGWFAYDANYQVESSKSWWWVENDDYIISFGQLPDYVEINRYLFEKWVPPSDGNILVLKRVGR